MVHLKSTKYKLYVKFTGPLLGSQPGKNTPASDYLREKVRKEHPDIKVDDEESSLPEEIKKGTTGFHVDERGNPVLFNYHIHGMLKEAASVLNGGDVKAFRDKVGTTVFVSPRKIKIHGRRVEPLERPLRAMTMQGPRTTLARSEQIAEGASLDCDIVCLNTPKFHLSEKQLRTLLDYGAMSGIGQWRNSRLYGQFEYKLKKA